MLGTFFTITPEQITQMLGYMGDMIEDITPLLLPFIAVGCGMIILWGLTSIFKK